MSASARGATSFLYEDTEANGQNVSSPEARGQRPPSCLMRSFGSRRCATVSAVTVILCFSAKQIQYGCDVMTGDDLLHVMTSEGHRVVVILEMMAAFCYSMLVFILSPPRVRLFSPVEAGWVHVLFFDLLFKDNLSLHIKPQRFSTASSLLRQFVHNDLY